MRSNSKSTITDVARLAGVSVGTVSRVLSKNHTVGEDLKKRVHAAVEELDYRPNQAARAMRTKEINILGLVVPDIRNPFFAEIASEVEFAAERSGYSVLIANSRGDRDQELRQINSMLERSVSGLIVVACSDHQHPSLKEIDTPIMSLDRRLGTYPLATVDNAVMSAELGQHIADCGHRDVAYITGPMSTQIARDRRDGFQNGFRAAAGDGCDLRIIEGTFSFECGGTEARALLSQRDRPSAIIGANDQIAIGVLRAARDLGIDVPGQLSVAGFDDSILAALVAPGLTTVAQPTAQMASAVVQRLLGDVSDTDDILLPSNLVLRDSTGSRNAGQ